MINKRDKDLPVAPSKPKFVGEVPVYNRLEGHPEEGKVVGTAKIEKLAGGNFVAHIDASGMSGEMLRRGFSMGSFSIKKQEDASPQLD